MSGSFRPVAIVRASSEEWEWAAAKLSGKTAFAAKRKPCLPRIGSTAACRDSSVRVLTNEHTYRPGSCFLGASIFTVIAPL